MVAALKHGRNSIGVEFDTEYRKQAASRLMNENTSLFGNAKLQIELKPHRAIDTAATLQETPLAYKSRGGRKTSRARS